ncbi:MAG: hypothetical protein NVS4B10_19480 [Myxococcales bacterium]
MRGAGMATADNHGGADRSSTPADPALRLRAVPWEALHGLTGPVCAAVAKVLAGAPADRALDKLLRAHKGLQAAQRAAVVEAVFGVALWRRRLAAGAGLPSWEGADPGTLLHALLRDLGGVAADRALALSPPAATLVRTPAAALTPASDSAASQASVWLGDRYSLPDWLARTLVAELGAEAEAFAASICAPGRVAMPSWAESRCSSPPSCAAADASSRSIRTQARSRGWPTAPGAPERTASRSRARASRRASPPTAC